MPRDQYMAKVRAALDALKDTNCLLIARSNADPSDPQQMKEGCERLQQAIELGNQQGQYVMAMMVRIRNLEQAKEMAKRVTGPKIFADVGAHKGEDGRYYPDVTMEQLTELGFVSAHPILP